MTPTSAPPPIIDDIPWASVEEDTVPIIDDDTPTATYRDWLPEDTRVITCRIGTDLYTGDRYESRDEARAATELKHGRILEANYVQGRAFFRVWRNRPAKELTA